ncbi:MAG: LamG domain-containing protein, partial [Candidatus Paceibacterota bacterium]
TTQKATVAKGQVFSNSLRNSLMINMITEYKLDGNASDTWGTHTAGTVSGASTYSSCPQGTCYSFDNIDDYIELADASDLRMTTGGTISVWIYPESHGEGSHGSIICKGTDSLATGGYYFILDSPNKIIGRINTGTYLVSSGAITFNQWQLITATFNGSGRKIYLNGVDITFSGGGETALPPNSSGIIRIGNASYSTDQTFDGYIDDVQIYNAIMPTSQIQQMYFAGINKLFAKNQITALDYDQRLAELSNNYAKE